MSDSRNNRQVNRREFLEALGILGIGAAAMPAFAQESTSTLTTTSTVSTAATAGAVGEMTKRKLGKTGVEVSILGLGGAHMAGKKDQALVNRITHQAIDNGVTFMDNAWEYANGFAEEAMGVALEGRRDKVFLMTKVCTHGRGKKVAMQMLEDSLKRLKTDYLDLWQIHEVVHMEEPDLHFEAEGVMEALEEAKKAGKVRYLGFTGHKDPAVHLKMLSRKYPFDACQLPLNCFDGSYKSFEKEVLPELQKQGIAALGMKSMGGNARAIKDGVVTAEEALRYAMSLPVATVISGMSSVQDLEANLKVARDFKPFSDEEMEALRKRTAEVAATGKYEEFKAPIKWDGAVGRKQQELMKQGQFKKDQ